MRTPLRYATRFAVILAVLWIASLMVAPVGQRPGPYVSALATLTVSQVTATPPPCNGTVCGPGGVNCRVFGSIRCEMVGNHCKNVNCV